ncbi:tetracycline repressor protein class H [Streptomyces cinnamoneus]|uniref:Tetracycline repressor protein class H n=1 Tax=Streptomyces cinnamoneus TaxID=53446 RepID=A0A2G1XCD4_STRCJ|nr:TetR/AcrR family transcriptional regulator C-terminal domain-containing protein [Streptomyces cinnamoneus]PHQ48819.1 tetracycline repressor protein class H [Streptomyces cinnamoneus]PPT14535.1 tetracycline repressor protein class H [Streptomyces cinnamoneus]
MVAKKRTRGERAGLTRHRILDAALELVDREGRTALTMRRLGTELGVEAMTLYHHVPNKDALLDGLVERVFAEALPLADEDADWRTLLRTYAFSLREALLRHPGVLPLVAGRPAVTPATLDAVERGLGALTSAGFPLGPAVDALNSLSLFVIGHTAAEAAGPPADAPGSAAWLTGLDAERHPLVVEAAATGAGTDDARRFRFAVEALLAGFAATDPASV